MAIYYCAEGHHYVDDDCAPAQEHPNDCTEHICEACLAEIEDDLEENS